MAFSRNGQVRFFAYLNGDLPVGPARSQHGNRVGSQSLQTVTLPTWIARQLEWGWIPRMRAKANDTTAAKKLARAPIFTASRSAGSNWLAGNAASDTNSATVNPMPATAPKVTTWR